MPAAEAMVSTWAPVPGCELKVPAEPGVLERTRYRVLPTGAAVIAPVIATFCCAAPVLVTAIFPLMAPTAAEAAIRAQMVVDATVPDALGTSLSELLNVTPSLDNCTLVGALMTRSPVR